MDEQSVFDNIAIPQPSKWKRILVKGFVLVCNALAYILVLYTIYSELTTGIDYGFEGTMRGKLTVFLFKHFGLILVFFIVALPLGLFMKRYVGWMLFSSLVYFFMAIISVFTATTAVVNGSGQFVTVMIFLLAAGNLAGMNTRAWKRFFQIPYGERLIVSNLIVAIVSIMCALAIRFRI